MSYTYHYYIGDIQYTIESDLRRSDLIDGDYTDSDDDDDDDDEEDPDYCKGCEAGADSIHAHTCECNRLNGLV